jgi:exopolyphosphatase/guanosine-5'-triphosphate,3'-diphosphate pyrophosphatase
VLVGVGGTVRALARYEQENTGYPFSKIHNFTARYSAIEKAKRKFSRMPVKELRGIQSFGNDRAETVAAGCAVVSLLMKKLGLNELVTSTHGLRDGIVASFIDGRISHGKEEDFVAYIERSLRSTHTISSPRKSIRVIRALEASGAIDSSESLILAHLMRDRIDGEPASSPESLFYKLMGEDSTLDHRHQLVLALSAVRSRNVRASNRLILRYGELIGQQDRESIAKIAACLKFLDLLEKGTNGVSVRNGRHAVNLSISPGARFPEKLFKRVARNVSGNLAIPVTVTVTRSAYGPHGRDTSQAWKRGTWRR